MSVLSGTSDGVYRSSSVAFDDVELVLNSGVTRRVRTFGRHAFAASSTGLYRSVDGGLTWDNLGVPRTEVYSVVRSPDKTRLYAGTHPAHLYVSTDDGETWTELNGFQTLPSRNQWHTPRHRNAAHVRSLGVHPAAPERVIAGVEVGGVHISNDSGETWSERREIRQRPNDLQYDVHHVLVLGADEYVISCGGGLYRTHDTGRSWKRLDADFDRPYFQEAIADRNRLYAAGQTLPPTLPTGNTSERETEAALFVSTDGETVEMVSDPGAPIEFISAWTLADGHVLAGTTGGRVLSREDGSWTTCGRTPSWIRSLAVV
ncbi:WD40/YVTN/BNR-like repeat-containing protein [Halocatena marina]|uniref:WD40/YVTN/BNR-like repeat-containing protein n=1 Tax=Halocatena marina TaxID=2934937 RepID=A0ABD5YHE4_9EURY|nr:glycosyl hydrolase [Halocatena marina]